MTPDARCDHECVCKEYRAWYLNAVNIDQPCPDSETCKHFKPRPAPAPDTKWIRSKTLNCKDCESNTCAEVCLEWQKHHDSDIAAQARKDEREKVLQKLIVAVADMGFPIENKSNEFDDGRACAYGYFMRQIQSLINPKERQP